MAATCALFLLLVQLNGNNKCCLSELILCPAIELHFQNKYGDKNIAANDVSGRAWYENTFKWLNIELRKHR